MTTYEYLVRSKRRPRDPGPQPEPTDSFKKQQAWRRRVWLNENPPPVIKHGFVGEVRQTEESARRLQARRWGAEPLLRREVGWWQLVSRLVDPANDLWETDEAIETVGPYEFAVRWRRQGSTTDQAYYFEAFQLAHTFVIEKLLGQEQFSEPPEPKGGADGKPIKPPRHRARERAEKFRALAPLADVRIDRRPVGPWQPVF